MHSTPVSLLERLRRPDERAAWERFVLLYTPLLCGWARRLGLDGPEAEDLVQAVFTVLVQQLPDFRYNPQQRFRGWLWTVTLNKHRERQRRVSVPGGGGAAEPSDVAGPDETDAVSDREYRQYLVGRALELMQADFQ